MMKLTYWYILSKYLQQYNSTQIRREGGTEEREGGRRGREEREEREGGR